MQNRIIGVVAPKGSGKTTRVAELVRVTPRVAIYDPMALTDYPYRVVASHIVQRDLHEAHLILAEDNFQLLFEPTLPEQDGDEWRYQDFPQFLMKVWRRVQLIGPMMLVVDEAHYTMSARTMPLEMWNIITNGRRYGLDVVWITQRFVGVNPWVRANADIYWLYRLASVPDLKVVADIAGPDVAEEVRNLRRLDVATHTPGQMLIWDSLDGSVTIEDNAGESHADRPPGDMGEPDGPGESDADNGTVHQDGDSSGSVRSTPLGRPAGSDSRQTDDN